MKKPGTIVIGPAWHSCGTYKLLQAQSRTLVAAGLETYFLAVCPNLDLFGEAAGWWNDYRRMTSDLSVTARGEAKLEDGLRYKLALRMAELEAKKRTQSFWRTLPAKLATLPRSMDEFVRSHDIETIICNHYFNLPVAQKIKASVKGTRIICETHDIQSRHMIRSDPVHPLTDEPGTYDAYFEDELRCCEAADEFIHVNDEEYGIFTERLPHKKHHLIYPTVPRAPQSPQVIRDLDFIIVASDNAANYRSLCWFLDEVWDQELNAAAQLRIIGHVDYVFRSKGDERYTRYGDIFVGRVDDVAQWYHRAQVVLAPVIEGEGIAIKTIEALSFGKPLLFSPLAIRGFDNRPDVQKLAGRCETPAAFRAAIKDQIQLNRANSNRPADKTALDVYNSIFAPEIYEKKFSELFMSTEAVP